MRAPSRNIVVGYTRKGAVVLFLVTLDQRGDAEYTPLVKAIPTAVLPAAA